MKRPSRLTRSIGAAIVAMIGLVIGTAVLAQEEDLPGFVSAEEEIPVDLPDVRTTGCRACNPTSIRAERINHR